MNTVKTLIESLTKEGTLDGIYDPAWCLKIHKQKEERTVIITPELAEQLLEGTDSSIQRPLKRGAITAYANDMANGKWENNDQPIQKDRDGNIIDGRHRLSACVIAKSPFITKFIVGVDRERVIHTIDTGVQRTKSDSLAIGLLGVVPHIGTVAGAIDYLIHYSRGTHMSASTRANAVTNGELMQWVDDNPTAYDELEALVAITHQNEALIYNRYLAGLYYIFRKVDAKKADKYINQLQTGIGLSDKSPAYYVRTKLMLAKRAANNKQKLTWKEKVILVIRGWNDFYGNDEEMASSSYHINTKSFPTILGTSGITLFDAK